MAHQRKCGRCNGSGVYTLMSGQPVSCANCFGTGETTVYTKAEKVDLAATWARRCASLDAIKARAAEIAATQGPLSDFADVVRSGFDQLEQREPERLAKLHRSIECGRLDDVIDALVAYHRSRGAS